MNNSNANYLLQLKFYLDSKDYAKANEYIDETLKLLNKQGITDYTEIFSLKANESVKRAVEVAMVNNFSILFYGEKLNFDFPFYFLELKPSLLGIKPEQEKLIELRRDYSMLIQVQSLTADEILSTRKSELPEYSLKRIKQAKEFYPEIKETLTDDSFDLLKRAIFKLGLSDKDVQDIKKVAKSCAALDRSIIKTHHIAEAIQYKCV